MTTKLWFSFDELSREDLYEILQVRQEVFTVEQNCAYQDADGLDYSAWHLLLRQPGPVGLPLVAYLRVLPPASRFREPSIGRLLTIPAVRRTGLARSMMLEALNRVAVHYPGMPVRISAQHYLEHFYNSLGFYAISEIHNEDGIPHRHMLHPPPPVVR